MRALLPVYCRPLGYFIIALALFLPFIFLLWGKVTDANLLFYKECSKLLKDKGVEWNDVDIDAFTEACAPVYDWIVDEYGADPELHQKLVDFLNDYRANNE